METNIGLNTQMKTTPKINTIDVLANAKPVMTNRNAQDTANTNITNNISTHISTKKMATSQSVTSSNRFTPVTPNIGQKSDQANLNAHQGKLIKPINTIQTKSQPNSPKSKINIPDQNIHNYNKSIHNDIKSAFLAEQTINKKSNTNQNTNSLVVDVDKLDFAITKKVRGYLKKLISVGGSDLHLKANSHIRARVRGDIVIFSNDIFTKDEAITFAKELTRTRFQELAINKEMDMTYIYDATTRFRVNIFFQMEGVSFAFRTIPTTQNTIQGLGLPEAINKIVDMERGLVLVTGITGSGKSTTLAAIINEINHKHAKHIITIEDPIEFVHKDAKSMINQRSVGMDTNSFANALKAALREDPDIILVGEMRDIETIEMALHAAETGHLVLSTLHTLDAKETINRIISVFPPTDQYRIRKTLSSILNSIISQRLLKTVDGKRTAAIEILFRTPRIELIIDEGRDGEILEALAEGKGIYQTQTFDQHLFELITNNIVTEDVAMEKATSPSDLKLRLQNVNFSEGNPGEDITLKR